MLIDLSLRDFLAETKSNSPAPGGGSVAALAGALGAALSIMVANLTIGSEKYAAAREDIKKLRDEGEALLSRLEKGVDRDTDAFNRVMAAYKMPKAGAEEKEARTRAIQAALKNAADTPAEAAEDCLKVIALALKVLRLGNSNAASDAVSAGHLAWAGMRSALYNVSINLGSVKDGEFVKTGREKCGILIAEGGRFLAELQKAADEKF
ncbi:MAG: cyclodeaminase/cyclohydrolase family protein [Spirochaetaceae bacterium]|jgi:formiminotetrahydrofolate cyclodeaminase|nr:cyclodeaminase/cyclohydrolase family protein [Spirochaetaceae bacterium]